MRRIQPLLVLTAILGLATAPALAEGSWTIVHAGTLLAEPGELPLTRQSVVIHDGRIEAVQPGFVTAEDLPEAPQAEIIDLSDSFVLPGLIDCHVHMLDTTLAPSLTMVTRWTDARWALTALPSLDRTLRAGFTTVRHVGGFSKAIYDLRRAVDEGVLPGPRIVAASDMLTPSAGAGDLPTLRPGVAFERPTSVCDGIDGCRRTVRAAFRDGADFLKIKVSAGVFADTPQGLDTPFAEDEIQIIVATAHGMRRKVAAHALTRKSAHLAVAAGVDSLEHVVAFEPETLELMAASGTALVPTLAASEVLAGHGDAASDDEGSRWLAGLGERAVEATRRAHEAGVRIAFGTDAGVVPHGENARELSLLVAAGLTPAEAIEAATVHAAELLGLGEEVGRIAPGMSADLIATPGNPLEDVTALETVRFVMRAGQVALEDG